jgi:hypothetical protein
LIQSESLKGVMNEIDSSVSHVSFSIRNEAPWFTIGCNSISCDSAFDFDRGSSIVESFSCVRHTCETYRLSTLSRCFKAMSTSTKTRIRINEFGMLFMQVHSRNLVYAAATSATVITQSIPRILFNAHWKLAYLLIIASKDHCDSE